MGLDGHVFAKGEGRGGLLRSLADRLAFLRAVDRAKTYSFGVVVVQDFEGVADDRNDRRGDFV